MTKTVNYTPEMTAEIVEAYTAVREADEDTRKAVVAELAARFEKSPRSIRAKLARERTEDGEQLYVKAQPVSKVTGEKPARKLELAETLVAVSGVNPDRVNAENIAKMNKVEIQAFIDAFENRS